MINTLRFGFKIRLIVFIIFSVILLGWNLALSSRRLYYSGKLVKSWREDVVLTALCPGKIEPRVQETVRSLVKGKRKDIFVKEGESVQKKQLLMEISDEDVRKEVSQKKIAYDNATADMAKASKDYRLAKSLYKQGAIPLREVDDAKQTFVRSEQARALVSDELDHIRRKAAGVWVHSPISGVLLKSFASDKEDISEGDELFKVARMNDLILKGQVDELKIAQVKAGQEAVITCDAFAGVKMPGRVTWIGAQAKDGVFAEIEVKIDILDSKELDLKPNLSCQAEITTGSMPNSVVVPIFGVRYGPDGPYVFRTRRGGWLETRPVKVIPISGWRAIVTEGLQEQELLLVPENEDHESSH